MDGNERIGPFSYKVSRGWDGNYPLGDGREYRRVVNDERRFLAVLDALIELFGSKEKRKSLLSVNFSNERTSKP